MPGLKHIRYYLKGAAFSLFGSTPLLYDRLLRIASSGVLTILNIHRVDDDEASAYEALRPALFDELLGWLTKRFRIVTFRELDELPSSGKPPLILSFDDGYRDFLRLAVPILKKHGVTANQNIIPACVDRGAPPFNVVLQDFIGSAPAALLREIYFPGLPYGIDTGDRRRFGMLVSAAFKNRPIAEQKRLFTKLERSFSRFDAFHTTPMMNADDIRQIATEHEIGAHSFEHATMTLESDEYLSKDLTQCVEWFAQNLTCRPSVYAFPNGAARPGQAEEARQAGFRHVLLVGEAFSTPEAWLHRRFTIHGNSAAEIRFRASGGFARTILNAYAD